MDNIKNEYNESDEYNDSDDYNDKFDYDSDSDDNIDYNSNIICKNMDPSLKKLFGINHDASEEKIDWIAPSKSGLDNSKPIIPKYFIEVKNTELPNLLTINYYEIIKDDIRNYRKLNEYQMDYIKNLNHDSKNELLELYNECMKILHDIMNEK